MLKGSPRTVLPMQLLAMLAKWPPLMLTKWWQRWYPQDSLHVSHLQWVYPIGTWGACAWLHQCACSNCLIVWSLYPQNSRSCPEKRWVKQFSQISVRHLRSAFSHEGILCWLSATCKPGHVWVSSWGGEHDKRALETLKTMSLLGNGSMLKVHLWSLQIALFHVILNSSTIRP